MNKATRKKMAARDAQMRADFRSRKRRRLARLGFILASLLLLGAIVTAARATTILVRYWWTPPTTGSVAVRYEAQAVSDTLDIGGSMIAAVDDLTAPEWIVDLPTGRDVFVQVRAFDAMGRPGVWSEWSDKFRDDGPPGGCGKPRWETVR